MPLKSTKTDGENPNTLEERRAKCAEKEEEIETLDETMLNATRKQKITEMQIPDTAEVRQDNMYRRQSS